MDSYQFLCILYAFLQLIICSHDTVICIQNIEDRPMPFRVQYGAAKKIILARVPSVSRGTRYRMGEAAVTGIFLFALIAFCISSDPDRHRKLVSDMLSLHFFAISKGCSFNKLPAFEPLYPHPVIIRVVSQGPGGRIPLRPYQVAPYLPSHAHIHPRTSQRDY